MPLGAGGEFVGGNGGGSGGGGGGITEIESTDDSVTVTNPTGPTVDLSVSGGGGGIGQTLSLSYGGAGPFDVPVFGLPTGWDGTGNASMGAQLTIGTNIGSGLLEDVNGDALPDGYTFTAFIFVENAEIFDIIGVNSFTVGTGSGTQAWGTDGGPATAILQTQAGISLTTPTGSNGGLVLIDNGSGGINIQTEANGQVDITSAGGIAFTDDSDQSIVISANGSEQILIETSGTSHGINLQTGASDDTGIILLDAGVGGVELSSQGTGSINLSTTGGGATAGIILTTQASDAEGIQITDNSSNGIGIISSEGISLLTQSADPPPNGIELETATDDVGGVVLIDNGSGGIQLNNSGTGNIIMTGVPDADPHVVGALFTTAGALMLSAG